MSRKRFKIYLHQTWEAQIEVIADNLKQAVDAVDNALDASELDLRFEYSHEETDMYQPDEGTEEHLEYADYEVNEDGELVEVN